MSVHGLQPSISISPHKKSSAFNSAEQSVLFKATDSVHVSTCMWNCLHALVCENYLIWSHPVWWAVLSTQRSEAFSSRRLIVYMCLDACATICMHVFAKTIQFDVSHLVWRTVLSTQRSEAFSWRRLIVYMCLHACATVCMHLSAKAIQSDVSHQVWRAVLSTQQSKAFSSRQLIVYMSLHACETACMHLSAKAIQSNVSHHMWRASFPAVPQQGEDSVQFSHHLEAWLLGEESGHASHQLLHGCLHKIENSPFENCVQHRKCLLHMKTVRIRKQSIWNL